jgi:steroid delta-isomerase-like uncharacterized protein
MRPCRLSLESCTASDGLCCVAEFLDVTTRRSASSPAVVTINWKVDVTDATLQTSLRRTREVTVKKHIETENRHDPDATVATFSHSKASYDIPAFGEAGRVPDHDAIRQLFVGMFSVFPDFHIEAGSMRHGDDHVFVEVLMAGTQHADWAGIPSTAKSFITRVACLFEFEGDQLVCERVYMDFGEIARQLGTAT